jgi:hypothetical protein
MDRTSAIFKHWTRESAVLDRLLGFLSDMPHHLCQAFLKSMFGIGSKLAVNVDSGEYGFQGGCFY